MDYAEGDYGDIFKWRINNNNKLEAFLDNNTNTDFYTFNNLNAPQESYGSQLSDVIL